MKADLIADVYLSPNVCAVNPPKYKSPSIKPPLIAEASNLLSLPNTKGRISIAATEKRNERNIIGDIEPSAVLIIANVPPQINVVNNSADSPVYFLIINKS
jgi:hypothetical protein